MAATGAAAASPAAAGHKGDWSVSGTAASAGAASKGWRPARGCGVAAAGGREAHEWALLMRGQAMMSGCF